MNLDLCKIPNCFNYCRNRTGYCIKHANEFEEKRKMYLKELSEDKIGRDFR